MRKRGLPFGSVRYRGLGAYGATAGDAEAGRDGEARRDLAGHETAASDREEEKEKKTGSGGRKRSGSDHQLPT